MESSSTTTAATPPVKTAGKRPRRAAAAAPLRDLTNLLPSSPTTPAPRSPSARRALPVPDASACSSAASATTPISNPSAAVVVEEQEQRQQPSSVKSPISTVYTSRKAQRRTMTTRRNPTGVKAPFPASCPPPGKAARTGTSSHSTRKASAAQGSHPTSSSAPCLQAKRKRHMRMKENSSSVRPKLPDDFIEKQRAYFREIDAFELPEEEASDTD